MNKFEEGFRLSDSVEVGNGKMVLFSGPCAVESYDIRSKQITTYQL